MTDSTTVTAAIARRRWHDQDVTIAYDTRGPTDARPLLLIMGIGEQRHAWPEPFCAGLVARGFRVLRMDNRDTGASTRFDQLGRPSRLMMALRPAAAATYSLRDMADDAIAVLDDLRLPAAHVVGVSVGGMIAQVLACSHPASGAHPPGPRSSWPA